MDSPLPPMPDPPTLGRSIRYLGRADVEAVGLSMQAVIDAVEAAFRAKGKGAVEQPPKTAVHPGSPDSFVHAMPASIPALGAVGVKWIAGYPENQARGLPYINGLLVMTHAATGIPVAVMDATWITAVRTAAASAVSAKRLAREDCRAMAVLGCGVQGRAHVEAMPLVLPALRTVRAFDPDPGRAAAVVQHAKAAGLEAAAFASAEEAMRGADVVVTAGPILHVPHATIRADWIRPGLFATAVDFDSYWHADALARFDVFTTDDIAQLEAFRDAGFFAAIPPIDADLGALVVGRHPGRSRPEQVVMACNLGVAIDDVAVGAVVLHEAERRGVGSVLPL